MENNNNSKITLPKAAIESINAALTKGRDSFIDYLNVEYISPGDIYLLQMSICGTRIIDFRIKFYISIGPQFYDGNYKDIKILCADGPQVFEIDRNIYFTFAAKGLEIFLFMSADVLARKLLARKTFAAFVDERSAGLVSAAPVLNICGRELYIQQNYCANGGEFLLFDENITVKICCSTNGRDFDIAAIGELYRVRYIGGSLTDILSLEIYLQKNEL